MEEMETLLQTVLPDAKINEIKDVKFLDDSQNIMDDYLIYTSDFSNRLKNYLIDNGVFLLSHILMVDNNYISTQKGMGVGTYKELVQFLSEHIVLIYEGEENKNYRKLKKFSEIIMNKQFENGLINVLFPQYDMNENTQIQIMSDYDDYLDDLELETTTLSVRSVNCLTNYFEGYKENKLRKLLNCSIDEFKKIPNMGKKSIDEIIDYLMSHLVIKNRGTNESNKDKYSNMITEIKLKLVDNTADYPFEQLLLIIDDCLYSFDDEDVILSKFLKEAFQSKDCTNFHIEYIMKLIRKNSDEISQSYLTKNKLLKLLPGYFTKYQLLDNLINQMVNRNKIRCVDNHVMVWKPSIDDWLSTLKARTRKLVSLKLEGKTLEEIGTIDNVTRERVRQIVAKGMKTKPDLEEDKYQYWYEKYEFSYEDMKDMFNISKQTYEYLKLVYKGGEKSKFDLISDEHLTYEIYKNVKKMYGNYGLYIDGELVLLKRTEVINALLKKHCKNQVTLNQFRSIYYEFLHEHNLDEDDKFSFTNDRAFDARIEDNRNIICGNKKCVRYYPVDEYDVQEFVDLLHLDNYKDLEISSLLLFRENKELMEEYDIRDEYELHNYLKKTQEQWNTDNLYHIKLTRMPIISFGNANRKTQVIEFLKSIAPVTLEDFCQYYEMEYGVLSQTVNATFFEYIKEFYHNKVLHIDYPLLNQEEFMKLNGYLTEDFYFIDDIKNIILVNDITDDLSKLNIRTLYKLKFKRYVNYVIRNTYSTATDYFMKKIFKGDVIDLNKEDTRLMNISAFTSLLHDLRSEYAVFEIQEKVYVKQDYLLQNMVDASITIDDFYSFVENVIQYAKNEKFYTLKSLIDKDFEDKLLRQMLPISMLELLMKNTNKVRYIKVNGNLLMYNVHDRSIEKLTIIDFYRMILSEQKKMYIYDFIDYVNDAYGVELNRNKTIEKIRTTEMYYDSIMEKVYINKEEYYKDIED